MRQASCAADSEDYNPNSNQCTPRPNPGVRPLPLGGGGCSDPNTVLRDGEDLVLCDGSGEPHVFTPAVEGLSPKRPAASCATVVGDGDFYVGSGNAVKRTLCRRGDALPEWPAFAAVGGPPVAYYPFEDSLKDHVSGYDLALQGAKAEIYRNGRVGKAFHFNGGTSLDTAFDSYVFHGPNTVVRLETPGAGWEG